MSARRVVAPAVALLLLAPAACSGDDDPKAGEAHLEVDGEAVITRVDGTHDVVDDRADMARGDRVEVTAGVGRLELADDVRLELRSGINDADNSVLVMDSLPVLEAGDLLVVTPVTTGIEAAGTVVEVEQGSARIRRALGVGVASYDAAVHLDSAGQPRDIPALREMQVPALGRPPQAPRPLTYKDADPWDRRFLGEAIDLGRTLEQLADGLTRNLPPGEGHTPGFFRLVLPSLDDQPDFVADLLHPERTPGETLVGAAITDLGADGTFADRWTEVFSFRDAGAEWGLVALDQAVRATPLVRSVEEAIGEAPLEFAAPPQSGPTTPTTTPGTDGGEPPTTDPPTTQPPPTTTPTTPPIGVPPGDVLGPVVEPVDPVVDLLTGLVGGLLGGLLSPPPPG